MCPRERLVIISYTTGLSFALERIGPLAAITNIVFYLLILYLFALPNTPENPFASIYSESLIKTTCQHLLLLVGFDTLIYRKYYNTPLYLWAINVEDRSLAELAPSYEVAAAYLVHMLEDRFVNLNPLMQQMFPKLHDIEDSKKKDFILETLRREFRDVVIEARKVFENLNMLGSRLEDVGTNKEEIEVQYLSNS
jgi:hypothetical protein